MLNDVLLLKRLCTLSCLLPYVHIICVIMVLTRSCSGGLWIGGTQPPFMLVYPPFWAPRKSPAGRKNYTRSFIFYDRSFIIYDRSFIIYDRSFIIYDRVKFFRPHKQNTKHPHALIMKCYAIMLLSIGVGCSERAGQTFYCPPLVHSWSPCCILPAWWRSGAFLLTSFSRQILAIWAGHHHHLV